MSQLLTSKEGMGHRAYCQGLEAADFEQEVLRNSRHHTTSDELLQHQKRFIFNLGSNLPKPAQIDYQLVCYQAWQSLRIWFQKQKTWMPRNISGTRAAHRQSATNMDRGNHSIQ
jgi:hypothetical protein